MRVRPHLLKHLSRCSRPPCELGNESNGAPCHDPCSIAPHRFIHARLDRLHARNHHRRRRRQSPGGGPARCTVRQWSAASRLGAARILRALVGFGSGAIATQHNRATHHRRQRRRNQELRRRCRRPARSGARRQRDPAQPVPCGRKRWRRPEFRNASIGVDSSAGQYRKPVVVDRAQSRAPANAGQHHRLQFPRWQRTR